MRTLALSVFCQARKTMVHSTNNIKALTGFGTAASNELFLKNKDVSIWLSFMNSTLYYAQHKLYACCLFRTVLLIHIFFILLCFT